jgi:hypothetical protein
MSLTVGAVTRDADLCIASLARAVASLDTARAVGARRTGPAAVYIGLVAVEFLVAASGCEAKKAATNTTGTVRGFAAALAISARGARASAVDSALISVHHAVQAARRSAEPLGAHAAGTIRSVTAWPARITRRALAAAAINPCLRATDSSVIACRVDAFSAVLRLEAEVARERALLADVPPKTSVVVGNARFYYPHVTA